MITRRFVGGHEGKGGLFSLRIFSNYSSIWQCIHSRPACTWLFVAFFPPAIHPASFSSFFVPCKNIISSLLALLSLFSHISPFHSYVLFSLSNHPSLTLFRAVVVTVAAAATTSSSTLTTIRSYRRLRPAMRLLLVSIILITSFHARLIQVCH
jgi:hypothetical protein